MNPVREGYCNKLKNKLFGLLCEYEKNREWEKFLDSILIELSGFEEERKTNANIRSMIEQRYDTLRNGNLKLKSANVDEVF